MDGVGYGLAPSSHSASLLNPYQGVPYQQSNPYSQPAGSLYDTDSFHDAGSFDQPLSLPQHTASYLTAASGYGNYGSSSSSAQHALVPNANTQTTLVVPDNVLREKACKLFAAFLLSHAPPSPAAFKSELRAHLQREMNSGSAFRSIGRPVKSQHVIHGAPRAHNVLKLGLDDRDLLHYAKQNQSTFHSVCSLISANVEILGAVEAFFVGYKPPSGQRLVLHFCDPSGLTVLEVRWSKPVVGGV
ncbi:hypothetical protein MNV49_002676 [Pseudohyphozyma bogoriensis]|nr:hypothetical protein MNV49_002676 [Pseudohyphozyma bogoriensis]